MLAKLRAMAKPNGTVQDVEAQYAMVQSYHVGTLRDGHKAINVDVPSPLVSELLAAAVGPEFRVIRSTSYGCWSTLTEYHVVLVPAPAPVPEKPKHV